MINEPANALQNALVRRNDARCMRSLSTRGFTLVELVVALSISAILVGFIAMILSAPVDAYFDQAERSALNDSTENISRAFTQDLRSALPNSVRIRNSGSRAIVEFLRVEASSIYRPTNSLSEPPQSPREELELDFDDPGDQFSIFGRLDPDATNSYTVPFHLVANNRGTGVSGRDAYRPGANSNVISPAGFTVTPLSATEGETLTLPTGFSFISPEPPPAPQPLNRIFAVSSPVTYICNTAARTLRRYSGYPITQTIPTSEGSTQLTGAQVAVATLATDVDSCRFRCGGGGSSVDVCQDVLIVELGISSSNDADANRIRILEQIPLDNDL